MPTTGKLSRAVRPREAAALGMPFIADQYRLKNFEYSGLRHQKAGYQGVARTPSKACVAPCGAASSRIVNRPHWQW